MLDDARAAALLDAAWHDPFAVLGQHRTGDGWEIRALLPRAHAAFVRAPEGLRAMRAVNGAGLFVLPTSERLAQPYRIVWDADGQRHETIDPYSFGPQLGDIDLHLFGEGKLLEAYRRFGANHAVVDGVAGVLFATWAPNAKAVSVVGDFNGWDARVHRMRSRGASGVWEIFVPGARAAERYKFELQLSDGRLALKADPYAQSFELRPKTAAVIPDRPAHAWGDDAWLARRASWDWQHAPMHAYEVHLGSWQRDASGDFLNYRELAERLSAYVLRHGFTHVELMPVCEHPLDESWGYQTTGYYAPTSRYGSPDDFRAFVDTLHRANIGVILDWVPAHFPADDWALARFDGTALYEHEDPRLGVHPDWGTRIFNYGRNEVRNFLLANALYWLDEFHVDGLRVDAVSSMLYLDYSRTPGQWLPNRHGGRENLDAIEFLRDVNVALHARHPGALSIAEESTAYPMVSRPTYLGGLGFSMKWNMGWMNDTLSYFRREPVHRRYHQHDLTFGQLYAYSENFVLPLSHDEVVHGKGSLLRKMPGDDRQRFAGVRLLFAYQMTSPGKKLNFMGNEFAQDAEWSPSRALSWALVEAGSHAGVRACLDDLNRLYASLPALHRYDFEPRGFEWLESDDDASVLAYARHGDAGDEAIVILNFTSVPRRGYLLGVSRAGRYREIFNSDSRHYGGSDVGNAGEVRTAERRTGDRPHGLCVDLPPLGAVILQPVV